MNARRSEPCCPTARLAREAWELRGYYALRQRIFCDEQRLFADTDRDDQDAYALPLVCVLPDASEIPRVVGVVRIYADAPGVWYGGRLGVAQPYRGVVALHRALVTGAVLSACALGAQRFLARVQAAKVPLLERMHFRTLETTSLRGIPHRLMEADLARYAASRLPSTREAHEGAP